MLERLLNYIREEELCAAGNRLLLAVSGGIDSMTMTHLFSQTPFSFGIAHCNFQLRGEESDADEAFVRETAARLKVPFFSKRFNTRDYAMHTGGSTQMAARDLRYSWFEQLRLQEGYDVTALAHHLDDQVETMLMNLLRGTGLGGLHGIFPKRGQIIRPLLCFTRKEIRQLAARENIPFREESSNATDHYLRNRLRHRVIPELKALNPNLEHSFAESARIFRKTENYLERQLKQHQHLLSKKGDYWQLSCTELGRLEDREIVLFHLLRPFGFPAGSLQSLLRACEGQPGKQFFSATHMAVKDREKLLIVPLEEDKEPESKSGDPELFERLFRLRHLPFSEIQSPHLMRPGRAAPPGLSRGLEEQQIALLDAEKLSFPLKARYWRNGDRFHPLGMRGSKKLSDFFVDQKIPRPLKRRIPLVLSGDKIVWVAGYRIAEPFKVSARTQKVCEISFKVQKIN